MKRNKTQEAGVVRGELKRLKGSKMAMLSIVGLIVIPLLYSGMLIGAFWDPYGKLDEMPVAVVNEDKGAVMDGKELHIGRDLLEELQGNEDFDWQVADWEKAMAGLEDHEYSLVFVIPEDFSEKTTTLKNENPEAAQLSYYVDDGYNYLTSTIGSKAAESLKEKVSNEVTKAYAETVFASIGDAADGFGEAAGGAAKLADGAKSAQEGARQLHDNLAKLTGGAVDLKQGVAKLADGSDKLLAGVKTVDSGSASLAEGLDGLASAGSQLQAGADQAQAAAASVASGARQLAESGKTLAAGASSARGGSEQVASGASELAAGLKQYAAAHGELADDAALQKLIAAAEAVSSGADQLRQGVASVSSGAEQMSEGQQALASGAAQLQSGVGTLDSGLATFNGKLNEASAGAKELSGGVKQVLAGTESLRAGLKQAGSGLLTVSEGSSSLSEGSEKLEEGIAKLGDGSTELAGKLGEASKEASSLGGNDEQAAMFAGPVSLSENKLANIPNYGTGMAPYFLSLGLYVGVLMSTVILPLRDAAGRVRSGWRWYLSKLMLFAPVVLLQTILVDTVLIYGIGLDVPNVPFFYAISAAIGLTFMTIVQFFVTLADTIGRFVAVVLLTLQLASSEGTYPAVMLPGWLRTIGEWMPMTHAIKALRLALAGGSASSIGEQLLLLAAYAAAFIVLTLALFKLRSGKSDRYRIAPLEAPVHA
ncbi:YhgE/Pip family protein [Cohnella thailandensis]|uniref:YhgE/Pip domain-containing protein n=1 Tax=Cohnella thailandensis TaxID=557557 RepID=A0A841SV55_9BACL|nr:YhgE/Pip domain-containing protein [Cohnella thailandensis]MBB6635142.1 YhgE/Pip domain-containing protein [Cohnella thailandensis]MBP1974392.1 putative membrane protein [Cohnella thailandensis]